MSTEDKICDLCGEEDVETYPCPDCGTEACDDCSNRTGVNDGDWICNNCVYG
mgnify:CR=1 FL=1